MTSERPKFGVMDQGWAAPEMSDATSVGLTLDAIRIAEDLGFDSAWVGQHHHRRDDAPFWGRIPATEVFLAYAGAKTNRIALGTGVRVLSTTTALRTAEEMSLLSLLLDGRVDFGIGLGAQHNDSRSAEEKGEIFRRLLDELLAVLSDDPETGLLPLSPTSPVDLRTRLFAAARDETTLAHLARTGVNLVVGQAEPGETQADYIRLYRKLGGKGETRGVRIVFLAPTRQQAIEDCAEAADLYFDLMSKGGYYKLAVQRGLIPEVPRSREEMLEAIHFIAGTPDEVIEELNAHLAVTGLDRLDAMIQLPRMDPAHVRRTMALLQQEVRPHLVYRPYGADAREVA
ncbi:Alkanal monooxygenase alpha chain [Hartmannibacter diazotrophicus]|uniref:Alkanal monooxygenase alpha chain n=1 Tax=Hartmannibacter diazotrophicus TaxID=1482074 RepID=A0A2C9D0L0_9HYPH|nr:LLM class flavin-dependent oxidoreductase [Hartmannibacter diazotrophicus]SON53917.1 Alkanal monooxygenase alpha chain [Hartmannibacter diazotrophicus]